ncbi:nitroreductase family protein [Desulfotalea psychrophila]|uniref:Related to NADPH-oxidoreductase n=1 Tax=Desulfotalea psychrophila (strain LSv54 / DSM 12343) TaxID=177439 RepID=Q6APW3_DESPS|nr:nitroreductase family protein [Desulfotalea psychrophila]CAG35610.1 related to NADPH-oxidoreductase [Desulfotalea psychrophila LSv54]
MQELLRKRRSTRLFQDRPVEAEKIDLLIEAALRSPSSMGRMPWHFIVVTEAETLTALAGVKSHGARFLGGAPLAIAVVADPDLCDVWIEDCSIASLILHLTATELGLGSCWAQIRSRMDEQSVDAEENVARILALPDGFRTLAIIGIGYGAEEKEGHPQDSLNYDRVHSQRYGAGQ